MRTLLAIALLAVLTTFSGGCSTLQQTGQALDNAAAQRAVYDIEGKYKIVLVAAEAYVNLPLCDKSKPPCATLSLVRQIQKAQPVARQALDAAESAVRTPGFGSDIVSSSVTAAESALRAFVSITSTLK